MPGVIFAGGEIENIENIRNYIRSDDLIVCADSGYDAAIAAGYSPSVVLGDMDSISKIPNDIEVIRVNKEKDQTDTQLCIEYLAKTGIKDILIIGALGGRYDHSFANIMLLSYGFKMGVDIKILSPPAELFIIENHKRIKGTKGDIISFFPVGGDANGIITQGLEYPLVSETLHFDIPRGISNVFEQNEATVNLKEGLLLAIHLKNGGEID